MVGLQKKDVGGQVAGVGPLGDLRVECMSCFQVHMSTLWQVNPVLLCFKQNQELAISCSSLCCACAPDEPSIRTISIRGSIDAGSVGPFVRKALEVTQAMAQPAGKDRKAQEISGQSL